MTPLLIILAALILPALCYIGWKWAWKWLLDKYDEWAADFADQRFIEGFQNRNYHGESTEQVEAEWRKR